MVSGVVHYHPDKPAELRVNELGVADACRRQGIGRQLMTAATELARKEGCSGAWLLTEPSNHAATELHTSLGVGRSRAPGDVHAAA